MTFIKLNELTFFIDTNIDRNYDINVGTFC